MVVTLGYFLLLTHYFYSQSIPTGLWLLATMMLLTATLIRLHGGPLSTTGATLRYAGLLTLQAIPFMLVLYLLFPRVAGPLWGLPQDANSGRSGLSDQMTPGNIANLALSSEIAFRVRFAGPVPQRDKLYWRGPVLENYDGQTWRPQGGRGRPPQVEALSPAIAYESTLEPHQQRCTLYGTRHGDKVWGGNEFGILYQVNLDGSGFKTLYEFNGKLAGDTPMRTPLLLNGHLYGMTAFGGSYNYGMIWKYRFAS